MVTVTKKMIQEVECPKCGAKKGKSCGHRKDKSRSHHSRMEVAQVYFNDQNTDLDYAVIEDYFDE